MEIVECDECGAIITPDSGCRCGAEVDFLYAVNYQVSKALPGDYEEEE